MANMFARLPTELILMIEGYIHSKRDLNALICTSQRFAQLFNEKLWKENSEREFRTIVLWAATRGEDDSIRKCLSFGAKLVRLDRYLSHKRDVDAADEMDLVPRNPMSHPLTAAAEVGSLPCVQLLLTYGVNPNFLDEYFETPLRQAAGNGHVEVMELLLSEPYSSRFFGYWKLRRPLKYAAARGQLDAVKVLFKFMESGNRGTSVQAAAQAILYEGLWHRHVDIVQYALKKGADVNDESPDGAVRFCSDVRPDELPTRPRPKLTQDFKRGFGWLVGALPKRVLVRGWVNETSNALHAALIGGDPDLVNLVLAENFDLRTRGGQALVFAIMEKNEPLIRELVCMGVQPLLAGEILRHQPPSQTNRAIKILQDLGILRPR